MPEARLQRTRPSLTPGYQFGDAGRPRIAMRYPTVWTINPNCWRPMHANAADQLKPREIRLSDRISTEHWNTIEGQDH